MLFKETKWQWQYAPVGTTGYLERVFEYYDKAYAVINNGLAEVVVPLASIESGERLEARAHGNYVTVVLDTEGSKYMPASVKIKFVNAHIEGNAMR